MMLDTEISASGAIAVLKGLYAESQTLDEQTEEFNRGRKSILTTLIKMVQEYQQESRKPYEK